MVVLKGLQLRSFENKNFVDTRFVSIPVRYLRQFPPVSFIILIHFARE